MFKNYLKIAIRNLVKHKGFTFINVFGLAVGMACSILILLYVRYELSYDRFHENSERIYRVERKSEQRGAVRYVASTPVPLASAMRRELPEVENTVRLLPQQLLVRYGKKAFNEKRFFFVDSTFFDIFTFPLRRGHAKTALVKPNAVVLSQEMAQKYFGDEDPLGKTVTIEEDEVYEVTGVLEPMPKNMHFHFDFLASFASLHIDETQKWRWLNQNNFYTYVLVKQGANLSQLEKKVDRLYQQNVGEEMARIGWHLQNALQPLRRIHLHSNAEYEIEPNGDATTIAILSAIGLLILLIACVNFINLTTARSARRGSEIGLRKVFGAHRANLVRQFLGESVLLALLALIVAAGLIEFSLPVLSNLVDFRSALAYGSTLQLYLGFVVFALFVGIMAGSYPAFFLAGFKPVSSLKNAHTSGTRGVKLRQGLVIFQFAVSIILIVGTVIMYWQLEYVRNKKLGFHKEQVVVLPIQDPALRKNYESFKAELLQHEGIIAATAAYRMPGGRLGTNTFRPEGVAEDARPSIRTLYVDYDFISTLGLELATGRGFSKDFATDATEAFIINEAAAKMLGWEDAVGKQFGWWNRDGRVIGVVRDFHFASLHQRIAPLVLLIYPDMFQRLALRVRPQNLAATLDFVKQTWQKFAPNRPFEYSFLDQDFDRLYKADQRLKQVWSVFAGLAIFIACLGLLGLAAFTAEQRTKEIGIRKVLGATVANVVALLSKDFVKLVLLANLIAWPVAWWAMNQWLQNFADRIDIEWWVFVLAGGLALVIALLTVSTQAIRAALANPVESLRYE